MLEEADAYRSGRITLAKLIDDLRGLYVEADPHDPATRADFEGYWSALDYEHELRTEPWAPPGAASDERLNDALVRFTTWVRSILEADVTTEHR